MPSAKDYYKILQVDPAAEPEVIKAAYQRLAKKYHPDRNKNSNANRRMQEINDAYDVLGDPAKRHEYDRRRSAGQSRSDQDHDEDARRRHEAEATRRHGKEAADAAKREAEEEHRRKEGAEAAQRRATEEQEQQAAVEQRRARTGASAAVKPEKEIVIDIYHLKLGGLVLVAVIGWASWYGFQTEVLHESSPLVSGAVYIPKGNLFWATAIVALIGVWHHMATKDESQSLFLLATWGLALIFAAVVAVWNGVWWFLEKNAGREFHSIWPDFLATSFRALFEPGFRCLVPHLGCDESTIWRHLPWGTQIELWHVWVATITIAALVAVIFKWFEKDARIALLVFLIPILALYKIIWKAWELGVS